MKKLILMQGAPGSGKSTVASDLAAYYRTWREIDAEIHSADIFWYKMIEPDKPEKYSYDERLAGRNHVWNQRNVLEAMQRQVEIIIVDNTNTLRKEAEPYKILGKMFDYEITAIRVDPGLEVCQARNAERSEDRKVPLHIVRDMHNRMENLL